MILFSCGASGHVETTLLGMYGYIRNKWEGAGRQRLPNDCGKLLAPKIIERPEVLRKLVYRTRLATSPLVVIVYDLLWYCCCGKHMAECEKESQRSAEFKGSG